MNTPSDITAVLVTHESQHCIARALQALAKESAIHTVVVVDNASTDGTAQRVQQTMPAATLLCNANNVGFGAANNQALAEIKTTYALLINPDAILMEGALQKLQAAAHQFPDATIVAPLLVDEAQQLYPWYARQVFADEPLLQPVMPTQSEKMQLGFFAAPVVRGVKEYPQGNCCVEWVPATVWLIHVKRMQQLCGFDPNLFLFGEDEDVCLRTRTMGWSCVLVPDARAIHGRGKSSVTPHVTGYWRAQQLAWSRLYLKQKYYGKAAARHLGFAQLRYACAKIMASTLMLKRTEMLYYIGRARGIRAFLKGDSALACALGRATIKSP